MYDFDKGKKKWNCYDECGEKVAPEDLEKHILKHHFWRKDETS